MGRTADGRGGQGGAAALRRRGSSRVACLMGDERVSVSPRGRVCLILPEAGDWRLTRPSVQAWTLKSTDLASRIHPRGTEGPRGSQGTGSKD